jgi:prevent-host-death family protein
MRQIGAFEAKNTLGSLLDQVERGEEVVITRRGRAVARLVPVTGSFDRQRAQRAAEALIATSQGLRLEGIALKELISTGRP